MNKTLYYNIFATALFLVVTFQPCLPSTTTTTLATDQTSLLSLKAYITVDPHGILATNWTNSSSICSWIGVTCGRRHRRVTALNLARMGLSGSIPPQLGNLSFLVSLNLCHNFLSGTLPPALFSLSRLKYFSLAYNNFRGIIPDKIDNLRELVRFSIESNQISGTLARSIFNMSTLEKLLLWRNKLTGNLPKGIGNLTMLKDLRLRENKLTENSEDEMSEEKNLRCSSNKGFLPREIGKLYRLQRLSLSFNAFTGSVPLELFNISTLRILNLNHNNLSGALPTNFCDGLPSLRGLHLANKFFSGAVPTSLSYCTHLKILTLADNKFTGFFPLFLGTVTLLERINLFGNDLKTESSASELSFITSLTNCRFLKYLSISDNPLGGVIPASIENLSSSLQYFGASNCRIKGSVPAEIGNLSGLVKLFLYGNELSGNIPLTLGYLQNLQGLDLGNNNLEGPIQESLCDLRRLNLMHLGKNQLSGPIPKCIGNITSLAYFLLDSNMLTSSIPSNLWNLKDLLQLDLSSNYLSCVLPLEMDNLVAAIAIDLFMNQLSGSIPSTIEKLQNLRELSMAHNKFEGSIPVSVGSMISLEVLDFSYNNLSGPIPKTMEGLQYLKSFDVSFNALSGEIPAGGPFHNFTMDSFKANKALCGISKFDVPICRTQSNHIATRQKMQVALFICAGVILHITIFSLVFILSRYKRKEKTTSGNDMLVSTVPKRISYYEILQATEQLNESNLLGIGTFGTVYKGVLRNGQACAVKVFNLQLEAAFKSFDVECEVLRNIRHRNLTKVMSSCSNKDFKALVLEYMPNGNLEKWLYSHNCCLDAMQRLNIVIDVASSLEYLHHGYSTPIVHCDLKPSNVLLDEEMIAHVSDFGIAKLLGEGESTVLTNTIATLGYIAPEYGLEGVFSTRCDVYSFGVLLMETFTRRRPNDDMFGGDLSLKSWVERSVPESSHEVIDENLDINLDENQIDKVLQYVSYILVLALKCTAQSPGDRINMKEVLAELQKIKFQFSQRRS